MLKLCETRDNPCYDVVCAAKHSRQTVSRIVTKSRQVFENLCALFLQKYRLCRNAFTEAFVEYWGFIAEQIFLRSLHTHTHTHTHIWRPFFQDNLDKPAPER